MAKKKIKKLTDEQYYAYIAGLKDAAPLIDSDGELFVPDNFIKNDEQKEKPLGE